MMTIGKRNRMSWKRSAGGGGPRIIRAGLIQQQAAQFWALYMPCYRVLQRYTVLQRVESYGVTVRQQGEPLHVRLLTRTLVGDRMQRLLKLFAALLIAGCATASAQSQSNDSPPLIAGRVSLAEGDFQIWRAEEDADGEWDLAQINDVVTVGTGLYTGSDGRAEFRVGPNTYRLSAGSRGGFNQLDYGHAVFNLENGSLNVALAQPQQGESPSVTVDDSYRPCRARPLSNRRRRGGGQARVTVFSGQGNVLTGGNGINVASGQALILGPGLSSINYEQAADTVRSVGTRLATSYRNVQSALCVDEHDGLRRARLLRRLGSGCDVRQCMVSLCQ